MSDETTRTEGATRAKQPPEAASFRELQEACRAYLEPSEIERI